MATTDYNQVSNKRMLDTGQVKKLFYKDGIIGHAKASNQLLHVFL